MHVIRSLLTFTENVRDNGHYVPLPAGKPLRPPA